MRVRQPHALVAGVAMEVDDDARGGVLDRNDIGWTEKDDGPAVLAVHREHWPISEFEPRCAKWAATLAGSCGLLGDQGHMTRVPGLAYKNKSSYDRFRL
jgi:hypothetical protein